MPLFFNTPNFNSYRTERRYYALNVSSVPPMLEIKKLFKRFAKFSRLLNNWQTSDSSGAKHAAAQDFS